ncbi:MAG: hypothetical protein SV062_13235 [Thermodesulfobacteriota bacterium]|nr:hypothetical protein [Thermodesulfobacteriota bacterium]
MIIKLYLGHNSLIYFDFTKSRKRYKSPYPKIVENIHISLNNMIISLTLKIKKMSNVKAQMSNEIQNPNAKKILIIHYRFLALSPKTIKKEM